MGTDVDKLTFVGMGNTGTQMAAEAISKYKELGINELHILNRDSNTIPGRLTKKEALFYELTDLARHLNVETNGLKIILHENYNELPSDGIHVITAKESAYDYTMINPDFIREMTVRRDAPLMYKISKGYSEIPDFKGLVMMVSNPVGPFAGIFAEHSGIDPENIHQFGTVLDTLRWQNNLDLVAKIETNPELKEMLDADLPWVQIQKEAEKYAGHKINGLITGDHSKGRNLFLYSSATIDDKPLSEYNSELIQKAEDETLIRGPQIAVSRGSSTMGAARGLTNMLEFYQADDTEHALSWGYLHPETKAHITVPMRKKDGKYVIANDIMSDEEQEKLENIAKEVANAYQTERTYATGQQFRRILILEDEKNIADELKEQLRDYILDDTEFAKKNSVEIDVTYNVKDAKELVDKKLYDLVISDEKLGAVTDEKLRPYALGHQFLEYVNSIQKDTRSVILSSRTELSQAQDMIGQEGIVAFVNKGVLIGTDEYKFWNILKDKVFDPTQQVIR